MPFAYAIEHDHLRVIGVGVITDADLREQTNVDLGPYAAVLYDFRHIGGTELDSKLLRAIGRNRDMCPFITAETRVAIVAPTDLMFGLARMHAAASGIEDRVGVFRTLREAVEWLGISPPTHNGEFK